MGPADVVFMEEAMERRYQLIVLLFAAAIYLGCIASPPALMDDVDAVQAQIAVDALSILPDTVYRQALIQLAAQLLDRRA